MSIISPRVARAVSPILPIFLLVSASLLGPPATATATPSQPAAVTARAALDRSWSVGAYGTSWHGAYGGYGTGAVLRWEVWPRWLGVEVFANRATVDWPDAARADDVGGFALTTPFRLHSRLALRLGAGFCAMISRIEPTFWGGPRNDAVLLGAHADAGMHWAASDWVTLFVQARGFVYEGADRRLRTQTAQGQLRLQPGLQADAGLSFHFGG